MGGLPSDRPAAGSGGSSSTPRAASPSRTSAAVASVLHERPSHRPSAPPPRAPPSAAPGPTQPVVLRESTAAEREAALLKRTYAASTFGGIGDYLRNKRSKLQLQNAELATNAATSSSTTAGGGGSSRIFNHKTIYINGYTDPAPAELRALFLAHGGRVEQYLDRKTGGFVTHVIATNLTPAKMKEYRQLKVVWPAWIVDSVRAGRLLPWSTYRWTPGSVDPGSSASAGASDVTQEGLAPSSLAAAAAPAGGSSGSSAEGTLTVPLPTLDLSSTASASSTSGSRPPRAEHLAPVAPSRTLAEAFAGQRGRQVQHQQQAQHKQQVEHTLSTADGSPSDEDEGELLIMDAPSPPPPAPPPPRPRKRKASPSPTDCQRAPKALPVPLGPSRSSKRLLALAEKEAGAGKEASDTRAKAGHAAAGGCEATARPSEARSEEKAGRPSTTGLSIDPPPFASVSRTPSAPSPLPPTTAGTSTTVSGSTTAPAAAAPATAVAVYPRPGSEAATLSAKKGYWMAGENVQAKRLMEADDGWRERHTAVNERFLEGYYANSRLHHLSTWKAELKLIVAKAQEDVSSGGSATLAPGSSQPAMADDGKGKGRATGADLSLASHRLARSSHVVGGARPPSGGANSNRSPVILHCDFDAFFVAVSLKRRPELVGRPVVVCHSTGAPAGQPGSAAVARGAGDDASTSEIASASYEARAFGIKAGMSLGQARKLCKEVQAVPYDFQAYKTTALTTYTILLAYADVLQAVSIDEALLDVTSRVAELEAEAAGGARATDDWARVLAERIRDDVRQATQCEMSIGIGCNILLARLATRRAKPAGSFHLVGPDVRAFLDPLDVKDLWGIGSNTRDKIATAFKTTRVGELVAKRVGQLQDVLGPKNGQTLYDALRGIDSKRVVAESERKSVSAEVNYGIRFKTQAEADEFLVGLAAEVARRMRSIDRLGKALTLKVMVRADGAPVEAPKFMGHGVCNDVNRSKELWGPRCGPTDDPDVLGKAAVSLLKAMNLPPEELRGIGMMVTKLERRVPLAKPREAGQTALTFAAKLAVAQQPPTAAASVTPSPPPVPEVIEIDATAPVAEGGPIRGMSHVPVRKLPPPPPAPGTPFVPSISQVPKDILDALPSSVVRETWPDFRRPPAVGAVSPASTGGQPLRHARPGDILAADGSPLRKRPLPDVSHIAKQLRPNRQSPMKAGVGLFQPANAAAGPARPSPKRAGSSKTSVASAERAGQQALDGETVELAAVLGWDLAFLRGLPSEDLRQVVADGREQRRRLPPKTATPGKGERADRLAVAADGRRSRSATRSPDRSPSTKRSRSPSSAVVVVVGGPYRPPPILGSRRKLTAAELAGGQSLDTLRDDLSAWLALEAGSGPSARGVRMLADFVTGSLAAAGHGARARAIGVLRWLERELAARWPAERASAGDDDDQEEGAGDAASAGRKWWAAFRLCKQRADDEIFIPTWGGPLVL